MKKLNTKGFTLIELLAVIVILAVIALIATPIIMNVINDSKEGSAKDSMYGYVKAVELSTINTVTATRDAPDGLYKATAGNLVMDTETLNVNFKGTKPKDGGYVTLENGKVASAGLEFDGYCIKYDGSKADVSKDCSVPTPAPARAYTEGDIIYYNPETNKKCTVAELNWEVNAKTGCLKWNVITVGDTESITTVDIMLDHNTTANVAWASKEDYIAAGGTEVDYGIDGNNNKGAITANKQLKADVTTWNTTVKNTARLITGQELANIVKNTSWTVAVDIISLSSQSWLLQNLSTVKPYGYWTSTAYSAGSSKAFIVHYSGVMFSDYSIVDAVNLGIRPVITISKSVIS